MSICKPASAGLQIFSKPELKLMRFHLPATIFDLRM
jgi:hypothetical protein